MKRGVEARGTRGSRFAGMTNVEAIHVIRDWLGGPPVVGKLYRVIITQGLDGDPGRGIMEFRGFVTDRVTGYPETALLFRMVNPPGANERVPPIWPLDIDYMAPAEPGDLDTPMPARFTDDPEGTRAVPGTPVQ